MDQRIIDLYDAFTHGALDRRDFLDRLGQVAGGAAAAAALLSVLQNDYAQAGQIAENDPRLVTGTAEYDAAGTRVSAYLARPKGGGRRPAVVVIHENRGLNPHIRDVARRLAVEGFLALAPDALVAARRHAGGRGQGPRADRHASTASRPSRAWRPPSPTWPPTPSRTARSAPSASAGAAAWSTGSPRPGPPSRQPSRTTGRRCPRRRCPGSRAPLLLHYAGRDERINAGIPAFEAALKEHKKPYQLFVYEGAQHAFNNDTNAARYDKAAADLAWGRTVEFLRKQLGAGGNSASAR